MTIFHIGGAGFIGTHLLFDRLTQSGKHVVSGCTTWFDYAQHVLALALVQAQAQALLLQPALKITASEVVLVPLAPFQRWPSDRMTRVWAAIHLWPDATRLAGWS